MRTKLYPVVKINKNTWEIDEFDAASMYLLEGTEKAMLIDTGIGIGDIKGAVEMITDKPLIVVITHNHLDHVGNAHMFNEVWMSHKDTDHPLYCPVEAKRNYAASIAQRQKGCIGAPYNMFNLYPYDIYEDIVEPADKNDPIIHDITDGMQFDLGGGRVITAYECPGHTKGEIVLLDEQNKMLFAGDAINYNLYAAACTVETTVKYLKRVEAMSDKFDGIYNGHHDYRAIGAPLDPDCLPTMISLLEDALNGNISPVAVPAPWCHEMPLTRYGSEKKYSLYGGGGMAFGGRNVTLRKGRNFIGIDLDKIK